MTQAQFWTLSCISAKAEGCFCQAPILTTLSSYNPFTDSERQRHTYQSLVSQDCSSYTLPKALFFCCMLHSLTSFVFYPFAQWRLFALHSLPPEFHSFSTDTNIFPLMLLPILFCLYYFIYVLIVTCHLRIFRWWWSMCPKIFPNRSCSTGTKVLLEDLNAHGKQCMAH